MKLKALFIGLLSVVILMNCRSDKYIPNMCFQEDILPIFVSNCSMKGCHNSIDKEEGWDLTTYEGIMKGVEPKHPLRSEIFSVIRGKNPEMPPEGHKKLSSNEVDMIKQWINFGARNTSNCSDCDTTSFTFSANVKPIINTWCVGCHNSGAQSGNVNLDGYNNVQMYAAGGLLMGCVTHQPGFKPMPPNGNKISECNIKVIQKWIDDGSKNN